MDNKKITVIMSTYNGADTIADVLEAYTKLDAPEGGYDFILINNASTDETDQIISAFRNRLSMLYFFEPRQGKNIALNRGIENATGDLIVFTDDDAVPEPDWLVKLARCADSHNDFSVFGGKILPRWPEPPPEWILEHVPLGIAYAVTPATLHEGPVSPGLVWGANMAIRRSVFGECARFDEAIGPRGTLYEMGQEIELTWRLAKQGHKTWFCPDAIVHHIVGQYQFDRQWLLRRALTFGRDICNQQYRAGNVSDAPRLFGLPRWMIRKCLTQYLRYQAAVISGNKFNHFSDAWNAYYFFGYLSQSLRNNFRESQRGRRF